MRLLKKNTKYNIIFVTRNILKIKQGGEEICLNDLYHITNHIKNYSS